MAALSLVIRRIINCKGLLKSRSVDFFVARHARLQLKGTTRFTPKPLLGGSGIDQRVIDSKRFRVQIESKSKGVSGSTMQLNAK